MGLTYMHSRGVIHRDTKPHNILYRNGAYKIADLGLAKEPGNGVNLTFATVGTDDYMPPEQRSPQAYADERSDIYALGATIHHVYFGAPPRYNPLTRTVRFNEAIKDVDPRFRDLIHKMMEPDPARRYQAMDEVIRQWRFLRGCGVLKTPTAAAPSLGNVVLKVAAGLAAGALIVAGLKALLGGK
jgi:serine/threonine-protein kinase